MQPLISVIVPVYKVESFLDRCVQSIQKQTYLNLEIILIDDGSPDQCGKICDDYAKMDKRIKVIHKENGGLADARNSALDVASGDYIAFVDSDDFIHPQMYERMLKAIERHRADIVITSWKKTYQDERISFPILSRQLNTTVLGKKEIQNSYFEQPDKRITYTVAWNKLYRREIFENRRFPKGKVHEDEFVTFQALYEAEKVIYLSDELYYYMVRDVSIMGTFNSKRFDIFEAYEEKINFFLLNGEDELVKKTFFMSIHMLGQYAEWLDKDNCEGQEILKKYYIKWKLKYADIKKEIKCSIVQKLEIFVFRYSLVLYRIIWKAKHIMKDFWRKNK